MPIEPPPQLSRKRPREDDNSSQEPSWTPENIGHRDDDEKHPTSSSSTSSAATANGRAPPPPPALPRSTPSTSSSRPNIHSASQPSPYHRWTRKKQRHHERPKDKFIVRIRGVPPGCGIREVAKFFEDLDVVDGGIALVLSPLGARYHTGEAFVEFETADSLVAALAKNREMIEDQFIEISQATPQQRDASTKTGAGAVAPVSAPGSIPKDPASSVVKMRGLPWRATETEIKRFLSDVEVVAIHFVPDQRGRSSGDAFIELKNEEAVERAMGHNKGYVGNRFVDMFRSDVAELVEVLLYGGPGRGGSGRARNIAKHAGGTTIRMKGLPYGSTEKAIMAFFADIGVQPSRIHRKTDGSQAYLEFFTATDCTKAMSKHKSYLGSRYVDLTRITYNEMAREIGLPEKKEESQTKKGKAYEAPRNMPPRPAFNPAFAQPHLPPPAAAHHHPYAPPPGYSPYGPPPHGYAPPYGRPPPYAHDPYYAAHAAYYAHPPPPHHMACYPPPHGGASAHYPPATAHHYPPPHAAAASATGGSVPATGGSTSSSSGTSSASKPAYAIVYPPGTYPAADAPHAQPAASPSTSSADTAPSTPRAAAETNDRSAAPSYAIAYGADRAPTSNGYAPDAYSYPPPS